MRQNSFPPFMEVEEGIDLTVDTADLKKAIRWTIFATTSEKSRFELDGLKWVLEKEGAKVIATDGRRLSCVGRDWKSSGEISCLIPTKTMHEAMNSLPDEGEVAIRVGERKMMMSCGDICMSSNLLVDNFPPYDRIIPKESLIQAVIPREELYAAVKRASNLASLETNMLTLELKKDALGIVGERQEVGGLGKDEVGIEYSGDDLKVFYNHRFLTDVLKVLDSEKIVLELWDATRPGVIKPVGDEDYLYVIMPMRPPEEDAEDEA